MGHIFVNTTENLKSVMSGNICQNLIMSIQVNHAIAGNNIHLKATENPKLHLKECIHPEGNYQYVGSTNSVTERWANTKSKCLAGNREGTGLEKTF